MSNQKHYRVGISIGDVNGIGPEVVLKSLRNKDLFQFVTPVIFASENVMSFYNKHLSLNLNIQYVKSEDQIQQGKINVVEVFKEPFEVEFGKSSTKAGSLAFASLEAAAKAVKNKQVDVLVTAPINKENIQSDTFHFRGHTEYLEDLWGGKSLMFMIHPQLKVGLVTNHLSIKEVGGGIDAEKIILKTKVIEKSLREDFAIRKPKIAILALNPHAGDGGLIGEEEKKIIYPAIEKLWEEKILAFGPFSADSFFTYDSYSKYDAVLCMYHDQGLIPFKTITFNQGVNYTAGLDFVRTSPDHGVGYNIAGENLASSESFSLAISSAVEILETRNQEAEYRENFLAITPEKKPIRKGRE
ncbi:MAG: 4-hydroxythreonine-4-phosphate dehydrogenase PdxA [Flavobacteriaceae bacterium]|nr:MAG: 4-hydroxythreonine-4-phosphate dehydrogenase PdxA [Flavobacteriaceae bacterium]